MTTPAKAAANAANAQLSTGPRTEEGKARSSANACKHGLTARQVVVRQGEEEKFIDLRDFMLADLDPQGAIEIQLFNILLHASWNIDRYCTLEADLMVSGLDPIFEDSSAKVLDRLHRYHNQALRTWHKALNELRTIQTNRALKKAELDEEEAKQVPLLASIRQLPKRTHAETQADELAQAAAMLNPVRKDDSILARAFPVQNEPTAPAREGC